MIGIGYPKCSCLSSQGSGVQPPKPVLHRKEASQKLWKTFTPCLTLHKRYYGCTSTYFTNVGSVACTYVNPSLNPERFKLPDCHSNSQPVQKGGEPEVMENFYLHSSAARLISTLHLAAFGSLAFSL